MAWLLGCLLFLSINILEAMPSFLLLMAFISLVLPASVTHIIAHKKNAQQTKQILTISHTNSSQFTPPAQTCQTDPAAAAAALPPAYTQMMMMKQHDYFQHLYLSVLLHER